MPASEVSGMTTQGGATRWIGLKSVNCYVQDARIVACHWMRLPIIYVFLKTRFVRWKAEFPTLFQALPPDHGVVGAMRWR